MAPGLLALAGTYEGEGKEWGDARLRLRIQEDGGWSLLSRTLAPNSPWASVLRASGRIVMSKTAAILEPDEQSVSRGEGPLTLRVVETDEVGVVRVQLIGAGEGGGSNLVRARERKVRGCVRDERGEPMSGILLRAFTDVACGGEAAGIPWFPGDPWDEDGLATTDERGDFEFERLPERDVVVAYGYEGDTNAAARYGCVARGSQVVDLVMARGGTLRAVVVGVDSLRDEEWGGVILEETGGGAGGYAQVQRPDREGHIVFRGLVEDLTYRLTVAPLGRLSAVREGLHSGDSVVVGLAEGQRVTGRVLCRGCNGGGLTAALVDRRGQYRLAGAEVQKSGEFAFDGVPRGCWTVDVFGWWGEDVVFGSAETTAGGVVEVLVGVAVQRRPDGPDACR